MLLLAPPPQVPTTGSVLSSSLALAKYPYAQMKEKGVPLCLLNTGRRTLVYSYLQLRQDGPTYGLWPLLEIWTWLKLEPSALLESTCLDRDRTRRLLKKPADYTLLVEPNLSFRSVARNLGPKTHWLGLSSLSLTVAKRSSTEQHLALYGDALALRGRGTGRSPYSAERNA